MNEYEIVIRDLKIELECANEMIEAYQRECEALRKAMLKHARKRTTDDDPERVKTRKILMPKALDKSANTDWLVPDSWMLECDDLPPFQAGKTSASDEEKIKVIQKAIRTLYHANLTE